MTKIQVQIAGRREGEEGQECLRDDNDRFDDHHTDRSIVYMW